MLETLIGRIGSVIEGHILEGDVRTAHVLGTDVVEDNACHFTGDGDVLTGGGESVGAGHHDLDLVTGLGGGEGSVESGEDSIANLGNNQRRSVDSVVVDNGVIVVSGYNIQSCGSSQGCTCIQLDRAGEGHFLTDGHGATNIDDVTCNGGVEVNKLGFAGELYVIARTGHNYIAALTVAVIQVGTINGHVLDNEVGCIGVEHPADIHAFCQFDGTILDGSACSDLRTNLEAGGLSALRAGSTGQGIGMTVQVEYHIVLHKAHAQAGRVFEKSDGNTLKSGAIGRVRNSLAHIVVVLNLTLGVNGVTYRISNHDGRCFFQLSHSLVSVVGEYTHIQQVFSILSRLVEIDLAGICQNVDIVVVLGQVCGGGFGVEVPVADLLCAGDTLEDVPGNNQLHGISSGGIVAKALSATGGTTGEGIAGDDEFISGAVVGGDLDHVGTEGDVVDHVAADNDFTGNLCIDTGLGTAGCTVDHVVGKGEVLNCLGFSHVDVDRRVVRSIVQILEHAVGDGEILNGHIAGSPTGNRNTRIVKYDTVEGQTLIADGVAIIGHNGHILQNSTYLTLDGHVLEGCGHLNGAFLESACQDGDGLTVLNSGEGIGEELIANTVDTSHILANLDTVGAVTLVGRNVAVSAPSLCNGNGEGTVGDCQGSGVGNLDSTGDRASGVNGYNRNCITCRAVIVYIECNCTGLRGGDGGIAGHGNITAVDGNNVGSIAVTGDGNISQSQVSVILDHEVVANLVIVTADSTLVHNDGTVLDGNGVTLQNLEAAGLGARRANQSTVDGVGIIIQINGDALVDDDTVAGGIAQQSDGFTCVCSRNCIGEGIVVAITIDHGLICLADILAIHIDNLEGVKIRLDIQLYRRCNSSCLITQLNLAVNITGILDSEITVDGESLTVSNSQSMAVKIQCACVTCVEQGYIRRNGHILKQLIRISVAETTQAIRVTGKVTVCIQFLERIVGSAVSAQCAIQIGIRISCRINQNSSDIQDCAVFGNNTQSGGYARTQINIYVRRRQLGLDSQSRTVDSQISVPTLLIDNGNIIEDNVLSLVNIRTFCDLVAIQNNVLQSNVVAVNIDQVLTVAGSPVGGTCKQSVAVTVQSHILTIGVEGEDESGVQLDISQHLNGLTVLGGFESIQQSSVVGINNLSLCVVHEVLQDTLDLLGTGNSQSDILNAGGSSVRSQGQRTVVYDIGIGAELVVSIDTALDVAVNQIQRSTVSTLDPDLDTVHAAGNGAVGSGTARSGDQHTGAYSVDGDVLQRTDDVLGRVAAVVGLDTVGQSRTLDGDVLDRINASGRAGLKHDTANDLACIALALYVNDKVLECNCIPYLDCRSVACVNNSTILNGRIVLNAHTAESVTSGQDLTAQIQGDSLLKLELVGAVVDVRSQDDLIAILGSGESGIQLSLSRNKLLRGEFGLCINGLSTDVVLLACGESVALSLNRQNVLCCVGTKINLAGSRVVIERNAFRSAYVNVCIQSIARNRYRLNVLAALVIGNGSSRTGQSRILDNDFRSGEVGCAGAFTEDDAIFCATDNGKAVNGKALLGGDYSLSAGCRGNIDSKIRNGCILFKSENGVPVAVTYSTGEGNLVSVTVDRYGLLELRVRTVGYVVSAIPLVVDHYVSEDFNRAAGGCSLEGLLQSCVVGVADIGNCLHYFEYAVVANNCETRFNISLGISIEVTACDVKLSLFNRNIVENPSIHTAAEGTAIYIDDGCAGVAALVLVVLSSQYVDVAVVTNSTVGVGDPFTAVDVDRTAGGHSDKAAFGTLTVTAVYVNSTVTAYTDQTAVVAGSTVHVDLSAVVNINGRSNALNTEVAVLTGNNRAGLNVQLCAASHLNSGAVGFIVD